MSTLYEELRRVIDGEVRFDPYSRSLYSTDASMYQIEPIGVVIPRHPDDVVATVDVAPGDNGRDAGENPEVATCVHPADGRASRRTASRR